MSVPLDGRALTKVVNVLTRKGVCTHCIMHMDHRIFHRERILEGLEEGLKGACRHFMPPQISSPFNYQSSTAKAKDEIMSEKLRTDFFSIQTVFKVTYQVPFMVLWSYHVRMFRCTTKKMMRKML